MEFKFFTFCPTKDDARKQFLRLVKKWHPDNVEGELKKQVAESVFKRIMAEYDKLLEIIGRKETKKSSANNSSGSASESADDGKAGHRDFSEEDFRYIISVIQTRNYISEVELCGFFLWFKSDYAYKSDLYGLDLHGYPIRYARKKKRFYINLKPEYKPKSRQEYSMEDIRAHYSSKKYEQKGQEELYEKTQGNTA